MLSFLRILFAEQKSFIVGGDRFIYYEKGKRNKSVAPDAFVVKEFYYGEEPDHSKFGKRRLIYDSFARFGRPKMTKPSGNANLQFIKMF